MEKHCRHKVIALEKILPPPCPKTVSWNGNIKSLIFPVIELCTLVYEYTIYCLIEYDNNQYILKCILNVNDLLFTALRYLFAQSMYIPCR